MTNKSAGINVDGGHGLGLIDYQITAGFKVYAALQCPLHLVFNIIEIKNGAVAGVILQL